jgi:hypothetical protein
MSPSPYFKTPSRNAILVDHITDEQQHHLYEHIPFGFKEPLILVNAIKKSDKQLFLHITFGLFLSLFRAQSDVPPRPIVQPLSLQCYPRYLRPNDIPIAYSSLLLSRKLVQSNEFTLYRFPDLFNDYMQPNVIYLY